MKRLLVLCALAALVSAADSGGWQPVTQVPAELQIDQSPEEKAKANVYKFRDGVATCYVIVQQISGYAHGGSSTISCIRNDK